MTGRWPHEVRPQVSDVFGSKSIPWRSTGFPRSFRKGTKAWNLDDRLKCRFRVVTSTQLRFFPRARLRIVELWKDKGMHIYARLFTRSLSLLFFIYRRTIYVVKRLVTRNRESESVTAASLDSLRNVGWYFRWTGWCTNGSNVSWGWFAKLHVPGGSIICIFVASKPSGERNSKNICGF